MDIRNTSAESSKVIIFNPNGSSHAWTNFQETVGPDMVSDKTVMLADDDQCFKVGSFAIINTRPSSPNPVVCVDMCQSSQQAQSCLSVSGFAHPLSVSDSADRLNEISVVPIVSEEDLLHAKKVNSGTQTLSDNVKKSGSHTLSQPHILSASQINQLVEENHHLTDTPSLLNFDAPSFPLSDVVYTSVSPSYKKQEDLVEEVACFKCKLCSFLNLDKARVLEHIDSEHSNECLNDEDSRVTCTRCSKRFISLKSLMIHFKDKHPGHPYERRKTKKGQEHQNTSDDVHPQVDVQPKPLPSEHPTLEPISCSDPVKRRGRPRGSKNLGITNLKKMCPDKSILEKELGFKCEINGCAVRMKISENIVYHRRCHDGNEYKCPECEQKHANWRNMSVHLWRSHVIDMELYSCDQCSFKTYSISKLEKLHKRIHSSERPCLCDTCGKGFKTPKQLRNHKSIHSKGRLPGGKGYEAGMPECEICHRRFSDCRMLRIHRDTVHMKKKPFLCNYCGYSASSCSTLKLHMRQHTGEKPFMCTMCSYKTSDHNSLRRHTMRHLGKKQYKCPHCSYECIQASTYKAHLNNKHPGQDEGFMFSCHLCRFRTVKKENFMSHVALHNEKQNKEKVETCPDEINSKDEAFLPPATHALLFSPLDETHTPGYPSTDTMELPRHFLCHVIPEGLDHSQIAANPMLHVVQDGRDIQVAPPTIHQDKSPT